MKDDFLEVVVAIFLFLVGIPLWFGVVGCVLGFTWRCAKWAFGGGW